MISHNKHTITIVGCGLAGCFLALLFAKKGYKVNVYERSSKEEICDNFSKRSYNLTFHAYGVEKLQKTGLWNAIQPHMLKLEGTATQLSQKYQRIISSVPNKKMQYYAVSRATLLKTLMEQASHQPFITIHYETSLLSINRNKKTIVVQHAKTKEVKSIACEVIFGADGVNSLVRSFLQQGQHSTHTQEYAQWSYKQFPIAKENAKMLNMQNKLVYTWGAKQNFITAIPNFDGSLSAILIFSNKDQALLSSKEALQKLFSENFPDFLPMLPTIQSSLFQNPEGNFVTVHTDPWYYKDFMAIIGDAAHGFYPFFGQGTSAAFGDCIQLMELIETYGTDWGKIFPLYQEQRKRHMDTVGELSKKAILRYMRYKRADYDTIYDKLELMAHTVLPRSIQKPVFIPVMDDPEHADDYLEKALRQRKIAKRLGIPQIVTLGTRILAITEKVTQSFLKF